MVKPDPDDGSPADTPPTPNPNNEPCTTCTHARSQHRFKLYYCEAQIMSENPKGHGKIKAPCPCTKYTTLVMLTVDKTDHGFSKQDSKDKDKYDRSGVDIVITPPTPEGPVITTSPTDGPPPSAIPSQRGKTIIPGISPDPELSSL